MHVTVSVTHTGTFYTHTEERLPITNLPNYITCIHPGLKREGSAGNTGKALVVEVTLVNALNTNTKLNVLFLI